MQKRVVELRIVSLTLSNTLFHHPVIQALKVHMKRSYEFPSRKAGQLTIFIGLGLTFLLQNILSLRYFLRDTMITDSLTRARQEMKICICLADDRFTDGVKVYKL